jgi:transcriptional regulator with GAF, ATPase, and Fis domain
MRRRSKEGRQPIKARRRKMATRNRPSSAKVAGQHRISSAATQETKLAQLARERDEALQHQSATADILKAISRSTFDLKTVLDALIESAVRLCAGDRGFIFERDGNVLRQITTYGYSREVEQYFAEHPPPVDRGSATGRAVLDGKVVHISDVLADAEYQRIEHQKVAGYRTALSVPLLRDGTTIGILSLARGEVNPFTDKQIELVTTFADQAVIAIENTRLFEAEQQRTRELSESLQQQTATADVLKVISRSTFDLHAVLDVLIESAARLCDADQGTITRQIDGTFYRAATYGFSAEFTKRVRHYPSNLIGAQLPGERCWKAESFKFPT